MGFHPSYLSDAHSAISHVNLGLRNLNLVRPLGCRTIWSAVSCGFDILLSTALFRRNRLCGHHGSPQGQALQSYPASVRPTAKAHAGAPWQGMHSCAGSAPCAVAFTVIDLRSVKVSRCITCLNFRNFMLNSFCTVEVKNSFENLF